jgi:hypothetical protein
LDSNIIRQYIVFFVTIKNKNFLFSIGQIKIEVLLITPLENVQQKFFVSPSKYWRQGRRPVNVGHRGLGMRITKQFDRLTKK